MHLQDSHDTLGQQAAEVPISHSMTHMHAVPPKDIAAAWNMPTAEMHRPVDAAAAFNNNSSYSTAFLSSNGHASKPSGHARQSPAHGPAHGQGIAKGPFGVGAGGGFSAGKGGPLQQPPGLVCPLTKVCCLQGGVIFCCTGKLLTLHLLLQLICLRFSLNSSQVHMCGSITRCMVSCTEVT